MPADLAPESRKGGTRRQLLQSVVISMVFSALLLWVIWQGIEPRNRVVVILSGGVAAGVAVVLISRIPKDEIPRYGLMWTILLGIFLGINHLIARSHSEQVPDSEHTRGSVYSDSTINQLKFVVHQALTKAEFHSDHGVFNMAEQAVESAILRLSPYGQDSQVDSMTVRLEICLASLRRQLAGECSP